MADSSLSSMIVGALLPSALGARHREIGTSHKGDVTWVRAEHLWFESLREMRSLMTGDDQPLIFLGVDIGKSAHYAVAVDRDGQMVYSKSVADDECTLRLLVMWARAHQAAVIVDQPGGTAALLLKLCWDAAIDIAYVPGLAMARARDFYAGESKTDPKDAFVLGCVRWVDLGGCPTQVPRQIRTCPIRASGSSDYGFAA